MPVIGRFRLRRESRRAFLLFRVRFVHCSVVFFAIRSIDHLFNVLDEIF